MTLKDWRRNGWLIDHKTSPEEVDNLLRVIERDLQDCHASGLSPDWRLNIAYNAALQIATVALAATGYRAGRESHHHWVIQSLAHTLNMDSQLIIQFDRFRKKRNTGGYEQAGMVSDQEAKEMLALAKKLKKELADWLRKNHNELLAKKS